MTAVLLAGALANKPGNGGEAWVRLTWALGLAELGVDVHLVESADLAEEAPALDWYDEVVAWAGLTGRATVLDLTGQALRGPGRDHLLDRAADGALLVDLSGTLADPALVAAHRHRVYVDLDPGWTQLWHAQGLLGDCLARYDRHLTVGDRVPTCGLPRSGYRWQPVRPAVLLSAWPFVAPPVAATLSTVGAWRSPSGTLERDGRLLGGKARQWRRLAGLPRAVPQRCRAVLSCHPADRADRDRLVAGGWELADPATVAHPEDYRRYVQASAGELSVAQDMYVGTGCGWTSDRTAAYLASGRPVVVQDTGQATDLTGSPAFRSFQDLPGAVAACQFLSEQDLAGEARALAESVFGTEVVLPRVLELAGVT